MIAPYFFSLAVVFCTCACAEAQGRVPSEAEAKGVARMAGKPVGGLLAEARVVPPESVPGGPEMLLVVSLKNVSAKTVVISSRYHDLAPPVCTDEAGRRLTWKPPALLSISSGPGERIPSFPLEPGCAVAESAELRSLVEIPGPGQYTVIAGVFQAPFGSMIAAPVKFSVLNAPIVPSKSEAIKIEPVPVSGSFAARWRAMVALTGKPRDGLLLESLISPVDARATNLVVSLKKVGKTIAPGERPPGMRVPLPAGLDASDYQLFVKDASGNCLPLREAGRTWMAEHRLGTKEDPLAKLPQRDRKRYLGLGEAVGFVFPLGEMFGVRPGEQYEVLVTLPRQPDDPEPFVAGPVMLRITDERKEDTSQERK